MRTLKTLTVALVAFSVTAVLQTAQAMPIVAVWTGTVNWANNPDEIGQTVTMSFSYTSEAVNASNISDSTYHTTYQTSGNPNFFSSVTLSLSGGLYYAMTTPVRFAHLALGDPADYHKSYFYNEAFYNGYRDRFVAYFTNTAVGGLTGTNSLDPSVVFSHNVSSTDPNEHGGIDYVFADASGALHIGSARTNSIGDNGNIQVVVSTVPAPGALAILGLGLLGLASTRRRKAA